MIHHSKQFLEGFIGSSRPATEFHSEAESKDLLCTLGGNVVIEVHPAGRPEEIIDRREVHNRVVTTGLQVVRDMLGDAGMAPHFIALGEDATETSVAMTALGQERFRNFITRRYVIGNAIYYELYIGDDEANGYTYQEAGLFCNSRWAALAPSLGGTMFARTTFTSVNKTEALSLTIRWTVTISAGA